jgi:hypothetical protein
LAEDRRRANESRLRFNEALGLVRDSTMGTTITNGDKDEDREEAKK